MNVKGSKKKNQVLSVNIFEQQDIIAKADTIKAGLKASTWHELETRGKFDKNDKLSFVSDDMLILGCDIGSETHYVRAIDTRGRELSKSAFGFSNTAEGFESMLDGTEALPLLAQVMHRLTGRRYLRARVDIDNHALQGLMKKLGATPNGISEFLFHGKETEKFQEENMENITDEIREVAAEFCMDAKDILGYVLEYWFDVERM